MVSVFCSLMCFSQNSKAVDTKNSRIDSLIHKLNSANTDSDKVKLLHQLYEITIDSKLIIRFATQALELCEKLIKSPVELNRFFGEKEKSAAENGLGYAYNSIGDVSKALEWFHKSLKNEEQFLVLAITEKQNVDPIKSNIAICLCNIATVYNNQGDGLKALEFFRKSLKLQEEISDKSGMAYTLNNMGLLLSYSGMEEEALSSLLKSLKLMEENKDKRGMVAAIGNIGVLYYEKAIRKPKLAIANDKKLLKERDSLLNKALELYQQGLKILVEIDDKEGLSNSYCNMGSIYIAKKENKLAEHFGLKALEVAKQIGFPESIYQASIVLADVFKLQGNYKGALEMHELYKLMADSLINTDTRSSSIKKQMEYEFETKENAVRAEQEKKDVIANEELQIQKIVRNSFIGGFAFVLLLVLIILRSFRQKQKANVAILKQKEIIEGKQKEILDSIYYARRIQRALITSEIYIAKNLMRLNKN